VKKRPSAILLAACVIVTLIPAALHADALTQESGKQKAANKARLQVQAFDLQDVRLLAGPFRHAQELDQKYLLSLEPDRLLHTFRINARLPSSAKPLGGWEEPKCELRGHFLGHYLSACGLMYASTGNQRLKEKVAALVAGLAECQDKLGNGYLSAYPENFFDRVESLQPVWAPYYTLHKLYAGLIDAYVYCGNEQALEICKKFGDWVIARNARLTDEQMQKMLGNEHGGMNETLANLYALTGEEKYLKIAMRFNHMAVIGPASRRVDRLTGLHANTQIPKFVGTARQYELTGEDWLKTASTFFWDAVTKERSYVIGGHSDGEHFSPKESLSRALGPNTTETCNTYNMLKLTRHLFCLDPRVEYADYYERALYNHILSSQHPESGGMCYYVPLKSGSHKSYNGPLDCFWCCTGTGVENHAKYGESIYFHRQCDLYVNLFIASELSWKEKGVKVRQETNCPDEGRTSLVFSCKQPHQLSVHIRHPWWATKDFEIRVNGDPQTVANKPGNYEVLTREWKNGDTVEVAMPFSLQTEGFRDNPKRFAFLNGPIVLAAEVETNEPLPAVVAEEGKLLGSLKPVEGKPSTFIGPATVFRASGSLRGMVLEPFYKIHGNRRYVVYWDAFTPDEWKARQVQYEAKLDKLRVLEARTVDCVYPGKEQSERDHKLQGEQHGAGDFNGRTWRHAPNGGWFSWEMKVLPEKRQQLMVTYWGSDVGRVFDVIVDGKKIATQKLEQNRPEQFYDEIYPVPADLLKGKEKITVRFQGQGGSTAGGVFGCRVVRAD
jgi:uncharacterized protein